MASTFNEVQKRLINHHGAYAEMLRQTRLWYCDVSPIRWGDIGVQSGDAIDLGSVRVFRKKEINKDAPYWRPSHDFFDHMVQTADAEVNRLRAYAGRDEQAALDQHPVPYNKEFRNKEVNDTVRLSRLSADPKEGGAFSVSIERACYLDSIATNVTCDNAIATKNGRTFRAIDSRVDGSAVPLHESVQANTIGVCAHFLDADGVPLVRWRKFTPSKQRADSSLARLGAMNEGWHCFSSGVLTWQDMLVPSSAEGFRDGDFAEGLSRGMRREIIRETGLRETEFSIFPYAFARELKRFGKPQFFFICRLKQIRATDILRAIEPRSKEEDDEYGPSLFFKLFPVGSEFRNLSGVDLGSMSKVLDFSKGETLTYELYASMWLWSKYAARTSI